MRAAPSAKSAVSRPVARRPTFGSAAPRAQQPRQPSRLLSGGGVVRAEVDEDEFEKRLARLNKSKLPTGVSRKDIKKEAKAEKPAEEEDEAPPPPASFDDETLWREFPPARADLILNIALAPTLIWLPLTASALGRCLFVNYRITDKRLIVTTTAPWKKDESNVAYQQVTKVVGVNRGFGFWGDMVVTLSNGDKLEMRSVPDWKEVRDYIIERKDAVKPGKRLTQEGLLSGKGFSA